MTLGSVFILCRFIHFTAVMLMFGVGLFLTLLAPERFSTELKPHLTRLLHGAVTLALLSALALLAVQAGQMGDGWQDTYQIAVWQAVLGTAFGEIWRWYLPLALVGWVGWCVLPSLWRYSFLLLVSTLLLGGLAQIGHTAMHSGALGWLHRSSQVIHLLSAAYWFGSLFPLLICLSYTQITSLRNVAISTMIRFSRWGHLAVTLVIASGVLNGAMILMGGTLNFTTPYQQWLLVKVVLVAVMVLIALWNRYRIVPTMQQVPIQAQRLLIGTTWLEMGLGAGVLLLVSGFATLAPN